MPISAAAALGLLAALPFARAVSTGFYSDDYTWLGRLPATLAHPRLVFTVFYRDFNPLFHASLAIDHLLGGPDPRVFHATSLLVHAACVVLLFVFCRRVSGSAPVAAAAALTWGWNVRLSEPVLWPAARGHALATLLVLAAFVCLSGRHRLRLVGATGLFAGALLCKETAFFPMMVAPLFAPSSMGRPARWRGLLPLAVLGAVFLIFNLLAKPSFHYPKITAAEILLRLPFVLLRPLGLGDRYGFTYLEAAAVLGAFGGIAWLLWRTQARAGFLWLLVCAAPVVPLYRLSSRYYYLLAAGYALVLCGLVEWAARRIGRRDLRRLAVGLAGLALALVLATNALLIQREIDDYALLARPYGDCLEALREPALDLRPGETLVVADASARDAVPELARRIGERGNIMKLIPYRPGGVGGLISLADAVNVARGGREDLFAVPAGPGSHAPMRLYLYDGRKATAVPGPPPVGEDRLFAARLGSLPEYLTALRDEPADD